MTGSSCTCNTGYLENATHTACESFNYSITLTGPGSTTALPAGPGLPQTATVTKNGSPEPGKSVSITLAGSTGLSGTTDGAGQVRFTYLPPSGITSDITETLTATCSDCSNTAAQSISVSPFLQYCMRDSEPGRLIGNPIDPASGTKRETAQDWQGQDVHPVSFTRSYSSASGAGILAAGMGDNWTHNYAALLQTSNAGQAKTVRLSNSATTFNKSGTTWQAMVGIDILQETTAGWLYTRSSDDSRWLFEATANNAPARLLSITQRNGWATSLAYDAAGRLSRISNAFGRSLTLTYDGYGRLSSLLAPDGQTISYSFDSLNRLATVRQSDNTSVTYLYEDARWPKALTGIVNEAGQRYASFSYDANGAASSTQHAGGAGNYSISYPPSPAATNRLVAGHTVDPAFYRSTAQVTDPLGNSQTWTYQGGDGNVRVLGTNGAFLGGQTANRSFVANSTLPSVETDFLGVTTTYLWDLSRQLNTATTRAANRPEAQTSTTQWHASLRLPVLVTEAGRSTAYSYDAVGNLLTQTITDTTTAQARTTSWTYDTRGLMASMTDPRGSLWRYTYDVAGNRSSQINPLGHTTQWAYDSAGRVTQQTEPNGLTTRYSYDPRGRVLLADVGGETTSYRYTATGQLAGTRSADGYDVGFSYDAAQRLVGASDNRGNSVQYTLDTMGNRVREEVKDIGGRIALATGRTINSLNKVASIQSALGQSTQLGYDANGQGISSTDPLYNSTRQTLDGLRRPVATTLPDNATATQAWNQLDQLTTVTDPKGVATRYQRNAFGEALTETSSDSGTTRYQRDTGGLITTKTDARGHSTQYRYDPLGRLLQASHSDGKTEAYQYDAPGQTGYLSAIDDEAATTSYERDVQGRVTAKTQTVKDNPTRPSSYRVQYSYSAGQLSSTTYPNGLKTYYRRNPTGQITGIDVQPPGLLGSSKPFLTDLTHTALGQPKTWRWSHCTNATNSATNSAANCDSAQRNFDADGRLTQSEIASYQYDAAGRITTVSQQLWASNGMSNNANINSATPISAKTFTWRVAYDSRNRITHFTRTSPSSADNRYSWDANSNRLTSLETTTSDADLFNFTLNPLQTHQASQSTQIEPGSNRLLGFTQTLTLNQGADGQGTGNQGKTQSSNAQINYTLDAAGNLVSDGLRQFQINAAGRIASVAIGRDSDAAKISYLHNALGQRVFKSEATGQDNPPSEEQLGSDFVSWLRANFGWLFSGGGNGSGSGSQLGQAFVYDEQGSLLAEYGNGGSQGPGSAQIIWLPTPTGEKIPVGLYKNSRLYAIHADHLGTPRLITDDQNKPVWQWPYSAWGTVAPSGVLKATGVANSTPNQNANASATTATAQRLERTEPAITVNLRFPGQYFDAESGVFYNYFRSYLPGQGRYTQSDPIGLEGGLNRFNYSESNPLMFTDPKGESITFTGAVIIGGITYGAYKTYDKFNKFNGDVQACIAQCEIKSCGNPERTALLEANESRCIQSCKSYTVLNDLFGVGKGPTGPKTPTTTPNIFK